VWEGLRKYNVGDYYVKHHDMNEEKAWRVLHTSVYNSRFAKEQFFGNENIENNQTIS
jgi:Rps23 Pro-64 3,4-dihydroxylase Tpa1-like proline 4-hydroxylase